MTGFFLRTLGLATLIYFVFVMPIGRKTVAQAAYEVWEQTHMRHALELKFQEMQRDMSVKMHRWQKSQAVKGDIDDDGRLAEDTDPAQDTADPPADYDAPPVPRPKAARHNRPNHSRGRPGSAKRPPSNDDQF